MERKCRKIIFLDIDGVLNSLPYFESIKDTNETYNEISDFHLKKLAEIYHLHGEI